MKEENLKIWNELKQVPGAAKKKIGAGRLKGMTDIKPQWRLQIMTEQFGAIGFGWYYKTIRTWTEEYGGEVSAHVEVNLFVHNSVEWSKPISGIGGAMLLSMENVKDYEKGTALNKYGNEYLKPYHSDEAYKMATTDALSVAMKQLGVAADVYMGLSDSKYDKVEDNTTPPPEKATTQQKATLKDYQAGFKKEGELKAMGHLQVHLDNKDLTKHKASEVITEIKKYLEAPQ